MFIIRNDDVAFDTDINEIKKFCEICDLHGYKIIQAITVIGECRKIKSVMSNDLIKSASSRGFWENKEVVEFIKSRHDFIGVHGLWHTHQPTENEIRIAKAILQQLGFSPTYFIPPFNEGEYPSEVDGLKTCTLSLEKGERLEDFLKKGSPTAPITYLHSWRFNNNPYTFEQLDRCLERLNNHPNIYKLNLGGGKYKIDGFINVDLSPEADLKYDLRKPLPFKNGEVSEMIAIHVIESFYKFQFLEILKDWKRVLNGKLTIEFTDLDATVDMYMNGRNWKMKRYGKWGIHSGQDIPQDPIGFHHYVWTKRELEQALIDTGFTDIEFSQESILHVPKRDWRVICKSI